MRTEFLEAGEDAEVNGRTVTGPLTVSRETDLGEISFVPLGADGNTSVSVAARQGLPATSAGHRQATPLMAKCQRHLERLQAAQRRGQPLHFGEVSGRVVEKVLADLASKKQGALALDLGDGSAWVLATAGFPGMTLFAASTGDAAQRLIAHLLGDEANLIVPR